MRMTISRAGIALAAASAVLATAAPAGADPSVHHGGGGLQLLPPTVVFSKTYDGTTVDEQRGTAIFSGDITGAGTLTVVETVHPDGSVTDVGTFSGQVTVDGRAGTLTLYLAGSDNGASANGRFVARGSDGLSGLTGSGTYTDSDTTGAGAYTLTYTG